MAYDPVNDVLYGSYDKFAGQSGRLYQISRIDGSSILLGDIGTASSPTFFDNVEGLAFDPVNGFLYGSDAGAGGFTACIIRFTPANPGGAICLGSLPGTDVRGLAYDASSATLYGVDMVTDNLLAISTVNAAATVIGSLGGSFNSVRGLAFYNGNLYGVHQVGISVSQLIEINTTSGAGSLLPGNPTGSPELNGLAAVPEPSTAVLIGIGLVGLLAAVRRNKR